MQARNDYFAGNTTSEESVCLNLFRFSIRSRLGIVSRPYEFDMKNTRSLNFKDYALSLYIQTEGKAFSHFHRREDGEIATEARIIHHSGLICDKLSIQELKNIQYFAIRVFKRAEEQDSNALAVNSKYCDRIFLNPVNVLVSSGQGKDFLHASKFSSKST